MSAEGLAEADKYGFQQWAVSELGCQLWNNGKKGRDTGIDGEMWFFNPPHNAGRLLVQVKAGRKVGVPEMREFQAVVAREEVELGVFFSRAEPTPDMRREAAALGEARVGGGTFRKMQLVSLATWYSGQRPRLPIPVPLTLPKDKSSQPSGARSRRPDPKQPAFTFVIEGMVARPKRDQLVNPAALPDDAIRVDDVA